MPCGDEKKHVSGLSPADDPFSWLKRQARSSPPGRFCMRTVILASAGLFLSTMPVHAQLLGGAIGSAIGGVGSIGAPMDTLGSATGGTLRGAVSTRGNHKADVKTGEVRAERSVEASLAGDLAQTTSVAGQSATGTGVGAGSASGSGTAGTQLIGTDAARHPSGELTATAASAAGGVVQAPSAISRTGGSVSALTGALTGSLNGSGAVNGDSLSGAIAGAAGASAAGQAQAAEGMPLLAPSGDHIGRVQQVLTDTEGRVRQVLVRVGETTALLPAANFSVSGNTLLSGMTQAQIENAAEEQEGANPAQ
jgi:hypothetical protein